MARLNHLAPLTIITMSMIAAAAAFFFELTHPALRYDVLTEVAGFANAEQTAKPHKPSQQAANFASTAER